VKEVGEEISNDIEYLTNVNIQHYSNKPQLARLSPLLCGEDYVKIITEENIGYFAKNLKTKYNRRDSILQSLEGKTVPLTAVSIDIVNSSVKVRSLSSEQAGEYYQTFIESASGLIESYGGYVLKNVGDCVIGFFPCGRYVVENHDKAVACGLAVSDMLRSLSHYFVEKGIPPVEARISADFGPAKVIGLRSRDGYSTIDLFGIALNSTAKILRYASPGQMVIGDNLFWYLIEDKTFEFKLINRFDIWGKHNYPVYSVKLGNGNYRSR
jgi:class 3 adenylate cyclase